MRFRFYLKFHSFRGVTTFMVSRYWEVSSLLVTTSMETVSSGSVNSVPVRAWAGGPCRTERCVAGLRLFAVLPLIIDDKKIYTWALSPCLLGPAAIAPPADGPIP